MAQTAMIVIKDGYLRKLVLASLRKIECRVVESTDSPHALQLLKKGLPHILVLDFNLSYSLSENLQLARYLLEHEASQSCKLLIITGAAEMSRVRAKLTGAREFIAKPFSPIDLRNRVMQILGSDSEEKNED